VHNGSNASSLPPKRDTLVPSKISYRGWGGIHVVLASGSAYGGGARPVANFKHICGFFHVVAHLGNQRQEAGWQGGLDVVGTRLELLVRSRHAIKVFVG